MGLYRLLYDKNFGNANILLFSEMAGEGDYMPSHFHLQGYYTGISLPQVILDLPLRLCRKLLQQKYTTMLEMKLSV